MKRRSLLATGASLAAAAATAGCLGRTGPGDGGDDDTTDTSTTNPDNTSGGDGASGGDDDEPRFDDDADPDAPECPDIYEDRENVDAVLCADESGSRRVSFGQNTGRLPRGETLSATLVNDGADAVGLNPYDWTVHRRVDDGDWKRVDRGPVVEPWETLSTGDRLRWRVGVGDSDVQPHPDENVYGGSLDLEPGSYAFSVIADVDGQRVAFVAPFAVTE